MMNWDPFANPQQKEDEMFNGTCRAVKQHGMTSKIDEVTETSITAGEGVSTCQSGSSYSSQESKDSHCDHPSGNEDNAEKTSAYQDTIDNYFLPLIEKSNIIRVEGEPYAKLGVIGKGGLCKVY